MSWRGLCGEPDLEEISPSTNVTLPWSGHPMKITPRVRHIIFWEITKKPRVTSKHPHATLTLANVSVHESTIRQTLNKNSTYGMIVLAKSLLSRKNISACLKFPKDHLDEPEDC